MCWRRWSQAVLDGQKVVALCRAAGAALQEGRLFRAHEALQRLHAEHFQDWADAADQARCDPLSPHIRPLLCFSFYCAAVLPRSGPWWTYLGCAHSAEDGLCAGGRAGLLAYTSHLVRRVSSPVLARCSRTSLPPRRS